MILIQNNSFIHFEEDLFTLNDYLHAQRTYRIFPHYQKEIEADDEKDEVYLIKEARIRFLAKKN